MFENMVLRGIFGPKRDEVTGEWRKLHNEELNDLYCSPNIVRVIKSRRMRWAGRVARMGERRGHIIHCVVFSDNCIQPDDGQKQYWPKHAVDMLCIVDNTVVL